MVAIVDFVLTAASISNVSRVSRRSMAFYRPQERAYIENHVYNSFHPKIVTLEVRGAVFFGSSMQVLSNILGESINFCYNLLFHMEWHLNIILQLL